MRNVEERDIIALAPNSSAVSNAKKISTSGQFIKRYSSKDESFYMGECKGSGKSAYVVSADFIDEGSPVFRCTCPSRQLPCKHSIALLYEMMNKKVFEEIDIPEDILAKRQKKEAREAKKQEAKEDVAGGVKKKSPASKTAAKKKIKKQLEGLELLRKMLDELLGLGLANMASVSVKSYRDLVKQLGDYYLNGVQNYFHKLVIEIERFQKDADSIHYKQSIEVLKKLRALEKKATKYLEEKIESDNLEIDDNTLYEELGGIFKLSDLEAMGLFKEDASLLQLSFREVYDEARKEFIDTAYWMDLSDGEISISLNYRPLKALKYIKKEDSCFDILNVSKLYYYPGSLNKRIRWESATFADRDKESIDKAKNFAYKSIAEAIKLAKSELKNILSEDAYGLLIAYDRIVEIKSEEGKVLAIVDTNGDKLQLINNSDTGTVDMIRFMASKSLLNSGYIFGRIYQSLKDKQLCMEPLSIITEEKLIRLEY